jgi:hypothetical protein
MLGDTLHARGHGQTNQLMCLSASIRDATIQPGGAGVRAVV